MQVHLKLNDRVTAVAEASEMTEIFEQLAHLAEVFGNMTARKEKYNDGKSYNDVYPVVRTDDKDNKYYELHSRYTPMKKAFGCNKKGGGLFPKRKDKEGNYLPDNGWMIFNKETKEEE